MDVEAKQGRIGIRRKLRRKRHKLLVIELMQDFAKNTTLHGLRYITERGLSSIEKLFWIITFLISICLCLYLIRNVWVKWQTSPVIVVLSEQLVSVREVPFPSVTICPQIKAKRSVYNFSAETAKMIERIANKFNWTEEESTCSIRQICLNLRSTTKQTSSFALKFSVLNTSSSLLSYPPETRQCYFPAERQLRYFKTYTANNCRLECLSNYTFSHCGCVWFHMPYHNSSKICRQAKKYCVVNAIESYATEQGHTDSDANTAGCSCLPSCVGIQYDAEILKTKFDAINYLDAVKDLFPELYHPDQKDEKKHLTQIDLYYKEPRFVSMRRSELFGLTDFLANCGGLLGLFLGFSFLSLVEIVYFLTLRLGCTLRRDMLENDDKWK